MLLLLLTLCLFLGCSAGESSAADRTTFQIQFDNEIYPANYFGRVYLFFSEGEKAPRFGPDWFRPEPFVSLDVKKMSPGQILRIDLADPQVRKFPKNFDGLDLTGMRVQAVVRFNPFERNVGTGVGNGFSEPVLIEDQTSISLPISQLVEKKVPQLDERSTVVSIESKLISEFHQTPFSLRATVTVPESYADNNDKRYPVIYEVPGFGGTHLDKRQLKRHLAPHTNDLGVEFIKVMLDPSCPGGHHVFTNSSNNGPYGDALVQELIPEIERQFRTDAREQGRFLTGHSSGGWSSFWLQLQYPNFFGGTWSTSPDPLDFRDFQRINLYQKSENTYVDAAGERRPLARMNAKVLVWYDDFAHMEDVLGDGGQLRSFEFVFSPRGEDGHPIRIWNRQTGEINLELAEYWKAYDVNLFLQQHWQQLEPQLRGKLHLYMGDQDNFYLEGATMLVKQTLDNLNSDAEVKILPGKDHMNLFHDGLHQEIEQGIAKRYVDKSKKR